MGKLVRAFGPFKEGIRDPRTKMDWPGTSVSGTKGLVIDRSVLVGGSLLPIPVTHFLRQFLMVDLKSHFEIIVS